MNLNKFLTNIMEKGLMLHLNMAFIKGAVCG